MNILDQIQQLRWEVEFNKSTEMPRQHGFQLQFPARCS